jgi:small multidrug resistance pump
MIAFIAIVALPENDSTSMATDKRTALFELLLAIATEQVGTSAMKASEGFSTLELTILAATGYIFSLIFFGRSMRILPMGFAYALWVGLGMITSSIVGILIFKELLSLSIILGLLMIAAGIVVLNAAQGETV